jgi:hypothetical protein
MSLLKTIMLHQRPKQSPRPSSFVRSMCLQCPGFNRFGPIIIMPHNSTFRKGSKPLSKHASAATAASGDILADIHRINFSNHQSGKSSNHKTNPDPVASNSTSSNTYSSAYEFQSVSRLRDYDAPLSAAGTGIPATPLQRWQYGSHGNDPFHGMAGYYTSNKGRSVSGETATKTGEKASPVASGSPQGGSRR